MQGLAQEALTGRLSSRMVPATSGRLTCRFHNSVACETGAHFGTRADGCSRWIPRPEAEAASLAGGGKCARPGLSCVMNVLRYKLARNLLVATWGSLVVLFVFTAVRLWGASASKGATSTKEVDRILDRHVESVGGRSAWAAIQSRRSQGHVAMSGMGIEAAWEMVSKAPNKRWNRLDVPGFGLSVDGFNGNEGWSQNAATGLVLKKGEELARLKRDADFYRSLRIKDLFAALKWSGTAKVDGETADVVEATPAEGQPEKFYFGRTSALLLRHDSSFRSEEGITQIEVNFGDYRRVDRVRLPFKVEVSLRAPGGSEMQLTVQCTNLVHNIPVDDSLFDRPEGSAQGAKP